MEESLIMEMWDLFIEYIPEKSRDMAADQYVDFLLGQGFEDNVLEGLMGYDPHMDTAIKVVVDTVDPEDDEDDELFDSEDDDEEY
jgi:hypothetical protein